MLVIANNCGEYTDCFAHLVGKFGVNSCDALTDWYNGNDINNRCKGCPFFKTDEQISEENERCATRNKCKSKK